MKKGLAVLALCISVAVFFIPFQRSLTFMETRINEPVLGYIPLTKGLDFQIVFTHSIHLTDVMENYRVRPSNAIQLRSMEYTDVAIGMPGYAEKGQTLMYEDGVYTLSYEEAFLPNFTLYIGDVDYALKLHYEQHIVDLKEQLTRGKSYFIEVRKLSFYEKMKGVKLHG